MSKKLYGYYSEELKRQSLLLGGDWPVSSIYLTPEGQEVEVTEVVPDGVKPLSKCSDLRYVGEVTNWVRST